MKTGRERIEEEGLFALKKVLREGRCCVKNCRSEAVSPRKKVGELWFCHGCWQARWRFLSPKRSGFTMLRDHARARRIKFTISYDYYCGMMDAAASVFKEAETRGETVSIDRVKVDKGYEPGNLQVITVSENTVKGNRERFLPEAVQDVLRRKREKLREKLGELDEMCPF